MPFTVGPEYLDPNSVNDNAPLGNAGDNAGDLNYGGGLPTGGDQPPAETQPAAVTQGDDTTRRYNVGDQTPYGTLTDTGYVGANGLPTGGRPLTAEEQAFQNQFPNGGSFPNSPQMAAATEAYNTSVANGANPTAHPLTIEEQSYQGTYNPPGAAGLPTTPTSNPGGPAAMAAGEGWYIDSAGRFHSDNDGANIRANGLGANTPYSIGPSTIIDMGKGPSSPFGDFLTGQDYTNAKQGLPNGLGLTGVGLGTPVAQQAAPGSGGPFTNFNPRRGDTTAQTYGTATPTGQFGSPAGTLAPGQTLPDAQRVVHAANGQVYVTDPNGFMLPPDQNGNNFSSKTELLHNVFDPSAREKLQVLANLGDMDAKTVISGFTPNMMQSQAAQDAFTAHNAQVQRTGLGTAYNPIQNPIANQTAFQPEYALIDAMKADGVNVSNNLVNGNIAYQDTSGQTKYIPGWRAGQLLDERAKNQ